MPSDRRRPAAWTRLALTCRRPAARPDVAAAFDLGRQIGTTSVLRRQLRDAVEMLDLVESGALTADEALRRLAGDEPS